MGLPEQELPPFDSWVVIVLLRICSEPRQPTYWPQLDHVDQEPQMQFTYLNAKNILNDTRSTTITWHITKVDVYIILWSFMYQHTCST